MKVAAVSAGIVGLAGIVSAQVLSDLPQCAQSCATEAFPSECDLDIECICGTEGFISDISCCVAKSCTEQEQEDTIDFALGICSGAGVTDLPTSAVCASSTSAESTSAPTSDPTSGGTTEAPSPTETGTETTGTTADQTSDMTSGSDMPTGTDGPTPTGNQEPPEDAGASLAGNVGAVAAFAAAAVALA